MSKIITVFGATGAQGGSVVNAILEDPALSKQFSIRAVTRDTSKPNAKELEKRGVELVTADMNSKESLETALKGSDTVFLVTNFWESANADIEKTHGINVTEASKAVGVKHLIFSSLLHVTEITNGRLTHVKHFDSKADVEKYIRESGIPATFVLPGYYMDNYSMMLQKSEDGKTYNLAYPVGENAKFPLLATKEDFGKFVKPALKNPSKWQSKQILAASDYYPVTQIKSDFEAAVPSATFNFNQVPGDVYKSFLPEFMRDEMLENHLLIESPGYYNGMSLKESQDAVTEGGDKLTTWKEFVQKNYS